MKRFGKNRDDVNPAVNNQEAASSNQNDRNAQAAPSKEAKPSIEDDVVFDTLEEEGRSLRHLGDENDDDGYVSVAEEKKRKEREKKKRRRRLRRKLMFLSKGQIAGLIILAVIAGALFIGAGHAINYYNSQPSVRVSRAFRRGESASRAGNYEKAIDAYADALSVSPNSKDAAQRLQNAYLGWGNKAEKENDYETATQVLYQGTHAFPSSKRLKEALQKTYLDGADYYVGQSDYDSAIALLTEGVSLTEDETLSSQLQTIAMENEAARRSFLLGDMEDDVAYMSERLMQFFNLGDYENAAKIVRMKGEQNVCARIQSALNKDGRLVIETDRGTIGYYPVDPSMTETAVEIQENTEGEDAAEQADMVAFYTKAKPVAVDYQPKYYFMIYCGDYKGVVRDGEGVLFAADIEAEDYYVASGQWEQDVPKGEQGALMVFNSGLSVNSGKILSLGYNGPVTEEGLFHGTVKVRKVFSSGSAVKYEVQANNGVLQFADPGTGLITTNDHGGSYITIADPNTAYGLLGVGRAQFVPEN